MTQMDLKVFCLLTCAIIIGYVESVSMPEDDSFQYQLLPSPPQHPHGYHHSHTRRATSRNSDLKDRVFQGYDRTINPDHKVVVTMGFNLMNLHLCPHKQVRLLIISVTRLNKRLYYETAYQLVSFNNV